MDENTNANTEQTTQTTEEKTTTQVEGTTSTSTEKEVEKETEKTFKQDDVDRILKERLNREKNKWETEYKQRLEKEKIEAEKLAKLSAAEKEKALLKKQQDELTEKEKQIALREMKLESVKILSEKGLPVSFVDLLTTGDADSTKLNIDTFDTAFKAALEIAVNERLKSSSVKPQVGATATDLSTKLEEARKKAIASGKIEDRVAYANVKHEIEQQTKK